MTWRIAALLPHDLPAAAAVHAVCFPEDPWTAAELAALLSAPARIGLGAWRADRLGGFVLADAGGEAVDILTLAVDPHLRRRGGGSALLWAVVGVAQAGGVTAVTLEVAADNPGARAFYSAAGFSAIGRRRGYFTRGRGDPTDALVLSLPVPPSG